MIIVGVLLVILGWLLAIHLLFTLGLVLIVIGVVLELMGAFGQPLFGRRHYW